MLPASTLRRRPGSASWSVKGFRVPLCERLTSLPQGSLAPARVLLSRALLAYSDPIRQSHGHAATSRPGRLYAAPSLCGSASATRGTFPTFADVLSRRAVDHTPVGPRCRPVARAHPGARLPRFVPESPPTRARLCQQYPAGSTSRRGIVRFMLRPVCLPRPPDWLRPDGVTCAPPGVLRSSVTPAWRAARYRPALGVRLNGRTGNLPLSGLAPDQSRAVSEAARQRVVLHCPGINASGVYLWARRSENDPLAARKLIHLGA